MLSPLPAARRALLAVAALSGATDALALGSAPEAASHAPAQLVVKLRSDSTWGSPSLRALEAAHGLTAIEPAFASGIDRAPASIGRWPDRDARAPVGGADEARRIEEGFRRTFLVRFAATTDLDAALAAYRQDAGVEYAERNWAFRAQWTPNDPYFASQGSWGQPHGDLYGVHRTASPAAWDISRGHGVVVAVVDTGLDAAHPDIDGNVWTNHGEIPGNGVDDDQNGYTDDANGWDFVTGDNDPRDGHGHGTHVAGTVAAEGDNGQGIVGVAPQARVMPLKGLDDTGVGYAAVLANALLYAVDNGADVINAAWGSVQSTPLMDDVVRYCHARGVLVVAAAGNADMDVISFTPAGVVEAITVAASDHEDRRASFSNWGLGVDVTAPGVGILSLRAQGTDMYGDGTHIVGDQYLWANGTSMACPHVSGAAALLIAESPKLPIDTLRDLLAWTADNIDAANPGHVGRLGGGRLDVLRALTEPLPSPSLSISGTVVDRRGQPVASAIVELGEMGSQRALTGLDGTYSFPGLRPGRYTTAASRLGFEFAPVSYAYRPLSETARHQNLVGVQRWEMQAADATFGAGFHSSSIALDAQGRPQISYFVSDLNDLRYARWTGSQWQVETVDASVGLARTGQFSSLARDSRDLPHISYLFWDGVTPGRRLRYAQRTDSGSWMIEDVDASDSLEFQTNLALDAADRPHVSYFDKIANALRYARRDADGWHFETVDASGHVGLYNSLALDSQGRPHIAYSDQASDTNGIDALKYAFWDGTAWRISIVDASNGFFAAANCVLALDQQDRPHIVYSGLHPANVRYAWWDGQSWTRETIRSGTGFVVGAGNSLALSGGTAHVLYHSPSEGLFHVRRTPAGWSSRLMHPGYAGLFSDLTADNSPTGSRGPLHAAYWDGHLVQLLHARSRQLVDPPWAAPAVAITSPANGSVVSGLVTVLADASSPVGILRAELLLDGALQLVDSTAPYAFAWDSTAASNVLHTLTARAFDATGVWAEHSITVQVVNVRPPPP